VAGVFVYEYACASGAAAALRYEGQAMLRALVEDFSALPGMASSTLIHQDLSIPPGLPPSCTVIRCRGREEKPVFFRLARAADWTIVIAPEFDEILLTRCRWVEEAGGRLLGPSSAAVALTGDKIACAAFLRVQGIPTPICVPIGPGADVPRGCYPAVLKPRHGAGSQATFLVERPDDLPSCWNQARAEGWTGETILQPFVPGAAASVALVMGQGSLTALLPAAQVLSADGRFRYLGGRVPLAPALAQRCVGLAQRAAASVPGLRGYVGVDLVLGSAEDGSNDSIIEINPRLTTSYVGLRALAQANLAGFLLQAMAGADLPPPVWRNGTVGFSPNGTVMPDL
jgi:predicted ATP-grasp superfamily ATP-dependent carboligase